MSGLSENVADSDNLQNDSADIDEHEVAELKQSIVDANGVDIESDSSDLYGRVFDHQYMSKMSPLSATSAKALARLRAYTPPPFSTWDKLPLSRRAAVLLLLYSDRRGDLRVVITMRAASLRSFSGHAALPGGKADALTETPFQISRREAYEEIGLPIDESKLPKPFRIEHICELPFNLAKTELAVRPCVAFLHSDDESSHISGDVEESMIPRLDAKEVAAVFSAPFHNFLSPEDEVRPGEKLPGKKSDWYQGSWTSWHEDQWRMHYFFVPIDNQVVTKPKIREGGQASIAEHLDEAEEDGITRYKVWGMTARILVDAARVAYGEEPTFEHNSHFGDEEIIEKLWELGKMEEKKKAGSEFSQEDLKAAAAAAKTKM